MVCIRFLVDENVPISIIYFLRDRGHIVDPVGETFAKSSPDALLMVAAEINGLVVVTFDKDFRQLIRQFPEGTRTRAKHLSGRITLKCREDEAHARIEAEIEAIEWGYTQAQQRQRRFIMQISTTGITFVT